MSSSQKNLDNFRSDGLNPVKGKRVAIVTAEWNEEVTFAMRDGAISFLKQYGFDDSNLLLRQVPGSFELIYGASYLIEKEHVDGLIVIGCVIQGETPHFTFISQAVATGIAEMNIRCGRPVVFGVLTTLNQEQALERAGGKHGNKGIEAAATLVKMLNFNEMKA
jgi:6,7-dimethyl-8-ribityllumazine synthase